MVVYYTDTKKGYYWSIRNLHQSLRGIKDTFLVQPHHILSGQPICWSKLQYFCGCLDQNRNYVWLQITQIPIKGHDSFTRKIHEDQKGNRNHISSPTLPCSTQPTHVLEQNWVYLWLFRPTTQLYRVAYYMTGLMHLHDEIMMSFYWYSYNVHSCIICSYVFGQNSHKITQFCFKLGFGLVECGNVSQGIGL